jgi:hypothetical protein
MIRYYSQGIGAMRYLTHFSLKRNASDKIVEILASHCKWTLQVRRLQRDVVHLG